jgi:glyoxylase-like metal-dependent hydrolase (beta-lactamase superfamily II)
MSDSVDVPEAAPRVRDDRGLIYPFAEKPQPGEAMEVAPGVLWVRHKMPGQLDHINVWLLEDGAGWALIDTSMNMRESREGWEQVFARYLNGKPVTRVICTHLHPDHCGLAGWLCEKFDAPLYMSRTDYLMVRMLVTDTGKDAPPEGIHFYRAAGFPEEAIEKYRQRFGGFGHAVYRLPQSYLRLQEGEALVIGTRTWRIVTGKGHAPEHVCLWSEADGLFISGDQILPRISSNVSVFPTEPDANPLQDWLDSCARLRDLLPDETLILPAHNEPFRNVKKRLQALIDDHENGMAKIMAMLDEPRRAVDVFPALFRARITGSNYMMATGESIAHLNCLMVRGLTAREVGPDGVVYYKRA